MTTLTFQQGPDDVEESLVALGNRSAQETGSEIRREIVDLLEQQGSAFSGSTIVASLPGQPPKQRTRTLLKSIRKRKDGDNAADVFAEDYADFLEEGTDEMAARPFIVRSIETAVARLNQRDANRSRSQNFTETGDQ